MIAMTVSEPLSDYQRTLVEDHLPLAHRIADQFWQKLSSTLDRDEVVSVAYQGLITAALRFDPEVRPGNDPNYDPALGFGPFARIRITGTIQDWLRKLDHVPKRSRQLYRSVSQLSPGRTPEDVAAMLGVDVDKVRAVTRAVENPPVSLSDMDDREKETSSHHLPGADATFTASTIQALVAQTVEQMSPIDKSVVIMRYYLGYSFSQIAVELGVSLAQVKVSHQEAVVELHRVMLGVVGP